MEFRSLLTVALRVNGRQHEVTVDVRTTLLDLLREHLKLTGTKWQRMVQRCHLSRPPCDPARQLVSVGETYDFQIQPSLGQLLWLEVRRPTGEWVAQAPIRVRSAWILPAFDPLLAGEVIK